jgi:hypothetical protein
LRIVYLSANQPQTLRDEYSRDIKILDSECKHISESLYDIIKTCHNYRVEEQDELKLLPQKYEHLFDGSLNESNVEH